MRRIVARNYTICCILFDAKTKKKSFCMQPTTHTHTHIRQPQEHKRFIINSMWVGLLGEAGAFFNYTFARNAAECKIRFHIYPLLVRPFFFSTFFVLRHLLCCWIWMQRNAAFPVVCLRFCDYTQHTLWLVCRLVLSHIRVRIATIGLSQFLATHFSFIYYHFYRLILRFPYDSSQ